ncbi:flagellar basal body P-ring formation chaperone FlgA [Salinarimonas chemoclinalis]|uniref:flagellar basal body P-ring formation chaperone FlgA n=1 Tax=Salinarimonas chemoclinalis TaxID=3241599 RepID=UPI003558BC41
MTRCSDPFVSSVRTRAGRLPLGTLARAAAMLALAVAIAAAARPSLAQTGLAQDVFAQPAAAQVAALAAPVVPAAPRLRGDVIVSGDVIRLGDLVADAPADIAATPVFHAPALGELGTIQVARLLLAAHALGVADVATGGREQVTVTRAARRIGHEAVAAALAEHVAEAAMLPAGEIEIAFDGTPPALLVSPEATEPVAITDLAYDPSTRRFTATAYVGPGPAERRAQAAVSGVARQVVSVAVLARSIARGEPIRADDLRVERRAVERVPADTRLDAIEVDGRVARRALTAGTLLRQGDVERPMLVERNGTVLMVYESGSLTLTLRGTARQAGGQGDVVNVENPVSGRIVQGAVIGPGTVRVGNAFHGRVAALAN